MKKLKFPFFQKNQNFNIVVFGIVFVYFEGAESKYELRFFLSIMGEKI